MLGPSTWYDWKTKAVSSMAISGASNRIPTVDSVLRKRCVLGAEGSIGRFVIGVGEEGFDVGSVGVTFCSFTGITITEARSQRKACFGMASTESSARRG